MQSTSPLKSSLCASISEFTSSVSLIIKNDCGLFLEIVFVAIFDIAEYTSSVENDLTANGSSTQSINVGPFK